MRRDPETARKAKERDGMECVKCGHSGSPSSLHAHHIVPLSFGGSDATENLATLCSHCHRYAPTMGVGEGFLEAVFEDYTATDPRPEADLLYFGQLREQKGKRPAEEMRQLFETLLSDARESETLREVTDPSVYWLQCAALAEYGRMKEAMVVPNVLTLSTGGERA